MRKNRQTNTELSQLPREFVDRLQKPFARFFHIEAAGGVILLLFTVAALFFFQLPLGSFFFGLLGNPGGPSVRLIGLLPIAERMDQRCVDDPIFFHGCLGT